jgi:hypothetical protein
MGHIITCGEPVSWGARTAITGQSRLSTFFDRTVCGDDLSWYDRAISDKLT